MTKDINKIVGHSNQKLTQDSKRAGTGSIDLYNGFLTFTHQDVAIPGGNLPLNISHVYNSSMAGYDSLSYNGTLLMANTCMGLGWKLNLQQSVTFKDDKYIYIDGAGTVRSFVKSNGFNPYAYGWSAVNEKYIDESGSGLTLANSIGNIAIFDAQGNSLIFNTGRLLQKMQSCDGDTIIIEYDSNNRIKRITDNSNRYADFVYVNGLLYSIKDSSKNELRYDYVSGELRQINYIDENGLTVDYSKFEYKSNGGLIVTDQTGYGNYYHTVTTNKVTAIEKFISYNSIAANGTEGNNIKWKGKLDIEYADDYSVTKVKYENGITNSYYFDSAGCYMQRQNSAAHGKDECFYTVKEGFFKQTQFKAPHKIQNKINNLLSPNFSFYHRTINNMPDTSSVVNNSVTDNITYTVKSGEIYQMLDATSFEDGKDYFLTVKALCTKPQSISDDYSFSISVQFEDNKGNSVDSIFTEFDKSAFDKWQSMCIPFHIKNKAQLGAVHIILFYTSLDSSATFSNIRLMQGELLQSAEITPHIVAIGNKYQIDRYRLKEYSVNQVTKITCDTSALTGRTINISGDTKFGYTDLYYMSKVLGHVSYNNGKNMLTNCSNIKIYFNDGESFFPYKLDIIYSDIKSTTQDTTSYTYQNAFGDCVGSKIVDKNNKEYVNTNTVEDYTHKLQNAKDFRNLILKNTFNGLETETSIYPDGQSTGKNRIVTKNKKTASKLFIEEEYDSRYPDVAAATKYDYDEAAGRLRKVTLPNGQIINYEYYSYSGEFKKITGVVDGISNTVTFNYTKSLLTEIKVNDSFVYTLQYDGFGNLHLVFLNGQIVLNQSFRDKDASGINNYAHDISYNYNSNTETLRTYYDAFGRAGITTSNNIALSENIYNNTKNLIDRHIDYTPDYQMSSQTNKVTWDFVYNDDETIKAATFSGNGHNGKIEYGYVDDRLKSNTYTIDNVIRRTEIGYQRKDGVSIYPDNRVEYVTYKSGSTNSVQGWMEYQPDELGREFNRIIRDPSNIALGKEEYSFLEISGTKSSPYISGIKYSDRQEQYLNCGYKYDTNGNIAEISENGILKLKYHYDSIGRLTREDNAYFNTTTVYTYDIYGNRKSKTVYPFTSSDISEAVKTEEYKYKVDRPDQWIGYENGFVLSDDAYDNCGNPIKYPHPQDDLLTFDLTWARGRMLESLKAKDSAETVYKSISYKYNSSGMRSEKIVNGVKYEYFYEGSRLLRENRGKDILIYRYGTDGITGFEYIEGGVANPGLSGAIYHYQKNIQGDIISILDNNGNRMVKYVYDAWGKHIAYDESGRIISDEVSKDYSLHCGDKLYCGNDVYCKPQTFAKELANPSHIGNINPFRYRGYYYDAESGLYYLQSRYYNPEIGRWISPDDIEITTSLGAIKINGLNLYAYCFNNPVMYTDDSGMWPKDILTYTERIFSGIADFCKILTKGGPNVIGHVTKWGGYGKRAAQRAENLVYAQTVKMSKTFGRIAKVAALITLGIDIGISIINDIQNGASFGTIATHAFDIGAKFAIGWGITSLFSVLIPIPFLGTAIGIGVSLLVDWMLDSAGGFTNVLKNATTIMTNTIHSLNVSINNGWNNFVNSWNKIWSFNWI